MAFMRGTYYIYEGGDDELFIHALKIDGSIPMAIIDDLVAMRQAELEDQGKDKEIGLRAIKRWRGNLGCVALCKKYHKKTGFEVFDKLVKKRGGEKK